MDKNTQNRVRVSTPSEARRSVVKMTMKKEGCIENRRQIYASLYIFVYSFLHILSNLLNLISITLFIYFQYWQQGCARSPQDVLLLRAN